MKNYSISPWKLAHAWGSAGYIRTIRDAQGEHIAHVCDLEDDLPEATANARLMAAAPDLLDALRDLIDYFGDADIDNGLDEALTQCRAAIAKATANN